MEKDALVDIDKNRLFFSSSSNENKTLWVSFSSRGKSKFELVKTLSKLGDDVLFVNDNTLGYYNGEIEGLCQNPDELASIIKSFHDEKYEEIIYVGSSMGGYAAILFGSINKPTKVLAFSPQIELNTNLSFTPSSDVDLIYDNISKNIYLAESVQFYIVLSSHPEDVYHIIGVRDAGNVNYKILPTTLIANGHNILAELSSRNIDLALLFNSFKSVNGESNEKDVFFEVFSLVDINHILDDDDLVSGLKEVVDCFYTKKKPARVSAFFEKCSILYPEWPHAALFASLCGVYNFDVLIKAINLNPHAGFLYAEAIYYLSFNGRINSPSFDFYLSQFEVLGFDKVSLLNNVASRLVKNGYPEEAFLLRNKVLQVTDDVISLYANGLYYKERGFYLEAVSCFIKVRYLLRSKKNNWRYLQSEKHMALCFSK